MLAYIPAPLPAFRRPTLTLTFSGLSDQIVVGKVTRRFLPKARPVGILHFGVPYIGR